MFSNLCVGDRFKGRNEVMQRQERVHCAPPAAVSAYRLHSHTHTHTPQKQKSTFCVKFAKWYLKRRKGRRLQTFVQFGASPTQGKVE